MEHDWDVGLGVGDDAFDDEMDAFASEFEEVIAALIDYLDSVLGVSDDEGADWGESGDGWMVM